MTLRRLGPAAAVVALVLGAACSGQSEPDITLPGDGDRGGGEAGTGGEPARAPAGDDDHEVIVAQAVDATLVVRATAQAGAEELLRLSADEEVSGRIVCVVKQQVGSWVEVELPSGRIGRTGWVARADITLSQHRFRVEVSRADHELTLYTGDVEALTAPVGLGPDAPPAGAELFIKDLVKTPDPAGVYGEFAYGLSGSSNDLTAFSRGSGVVAVHGTGDPSGLGSDVPYGAIALGDDVMTRLVDTIGLPLGTPVDVVA